MAKYAQEMEKIFDSVFSGSSIDPKSGKMVVSDPAAFARADETLKTVIEKVAKEKWLMKENATDSLSHMAGLINFSELNAGPSSAKASKVPTKPTQAPAGGLGEAAKGGLGFGKVFDTLKEFDASTFGDANSGNEVVDGNDSFDAAQMGAGDQGAVSGSDADMISGESDPSLLGDDPAMGQQGGQPGAPMGGQQAPMDGMDGSDNPLDFDLSDLSSFDQVGGQQAPVDGGTPGLDDEGLDGGIPGQQGAPVGGQQAPMGGQQAPVGQQGAPMGHDPDELI